MIVVDCLLSPHHNTTPLLYLREIYTQPSIFSATADYQMKLNKYSLPACNLILIADSFINLTKCHKI